MSKWNHPVTMLVPSDYTPRVKVLTSQSMQDKAYYVILGRQNGHCAGCSRHHTEFEQRLALDHDHKTGKIRGLLCLNCNLILGLSYDSWASLNCLAAYLQEHSK
jgi:hypothetical protein